ncbi:MAG: COG1615 family transporter, partial [Symploca sp. SIO2B6]|nr:COG1615 family transporter [Symploca sp. SIO2B6]
MGQLTLTQRIGFTVFTIVALGILLSGTLVHLLTESWWFEAVQFADVFWTRLTWQVAIGAIAFLLYGGFLWGNYAIASRVTKYHTYRLLNEMNLHAYARYVPTMILAFIVMLALGGGAVGYSMWETALKFLNGTSFDLADPIYQQDVGFYLFQLPFYQQVHGWLLGLLIWSLIIALVIYGIKGAIEPDRGWQYALRGGSKTHISLLLVAIALLFAVGFWLQRYELLYSSQGVVFGAGYTDVHAQEQAYWFMSMATLVMAGLFVASLWRMSLVVPVIGLGIYVVAWIGMTQLYPQFQQRFIVEPNELTKETPYIEHNLDFTRWAYGLDDVTRERYPAETNLNREALAQN